MWTEKGGGFSKKPWCFIWGRGCWRSVHVDNKILCTKYCKVEQIWCLHLKTYILVPIHNKVCTGIHKNWKENYCGRVLQNSTWFYRGLAKKQCWSTTLHALPRRGSEMSKNLSTLFMGAPMFFRFRATSRRTLVKSIFFGNLQILRKFTK